MKTKTCTYTGPPGIEMALPLGGAIPSAPIGPLAQWSPLCPQTSEDGRTAPREEESEVLSCSASAFISSLLPRGPDRNLSQELLHGRRACGV